MKKSTTVTLTIVAAAGLAACSRQRPDPCEAATFSDEACQEAVRNGGYYWRGSWMPMTYHYPYPYYYDAYRGYRRRGGAVRSAPAGAYSHSSASAPASGVTREGFGSTGASHASGGAGA